MLIDGQYEYRNVKKNNNIYNIHHRINKNIIKNSYPNIRSINWSNNIPHIEHINGIPQNGRIKK